jgi:hypothetical protein
MKGTIDTLSAVVLTARYGSPVDFVDLQCSADDPKIFFELGSRPWSHLKTSKDS